MMMMEWVMMEGRSDGFCGTTVISYRGRGHNEPSRDQPLQDMKPTCTHREVEHVFLRPSL